jgi:predicted Zn-dependent protease
MKFFTLLTAAVLLTGCQFKFGSHYQVKIDPNFSADQQDQVFHSIEKWQDVSSNSVTFNTVIASCNIANDKNEICVHASSQAQINSLSGTDNYSGYTEAEGNNSDVYIPLDTLQPGAIFLTTIEHELGHALGLVHTGKGTVMCASSTCAAPEVTCADIQQYDSLRNYFTVCQ